MTYVLTLSDSFNSSQQDFFFFWSCHVAYGLLVPPCGTEPGPPAVEVQSPNHWVTREVLQKNFLNPRFLMLHHYLIFPFHWNIIFNLLTIKNVHETGTPTLSKNRNTTLLPVFVRAWKPAYEAGRHLPFLKVKTTGKSF